MRRVNYTADERKEQIVLLFQIAIQNGEPNEMTMNKVAKRLELAPSTHLQGIMQKLVTEEILTVKWGERAPGKPRREYSLNENLIKRPQRLIKINGQMELGI